MGEKKVKKKYVQNYLEYLTASTFTEENTKIK